jgi:hypothetical protein
MKERIMWVGEKVGMWNVQLKRWDWWRLISFAWFLQGKGGTDVWYDQGREDGWGIVSL